MSCQYGSMAVPKLGGVERQRSSPAAGPFGRRLPTSLDFFCVADTPSLQVPLQLLAGHEPHAVDDRFRAALRPYGTTVDDDHGLHRYTESG